MIHNAESESFAPCMLRECADPRCREHQRQVKVAKRARDAYAAKYPPAHNDGRDSDE